MVRPAKQEMRVLLEREERALDELVEPEEAYLSVGAIGGEQPVKDVLGLNERQHHIAELFIPQLSVHNIIPNQLGANGVRAWHPPTTARAI